MNTPTPQSQSETPRTDDHERELSDCRTLLKVESDAVTALSAKAHDLTQQVAALQADKEADLARVSIGYIDGGDTRADWMMIKLNVSPVGYRLGQPVSVILPILDAARTPQGAGKGQP